MSIRWLDKVLMAKIETAYGTDPTPTGVNAVLAKDITISPMEGSDVDRELERADGGGSGTIPVDVHVTMSFMVELVPSGTPGTAPAWGPLVRACRWAEVIDAGTSVTYTGIFKDQESVTIYFLVGNTLHAMTGTRGNVKIEVTASGIPYLNFSMTGLFVKPVENGAAIVPTYAAWQSPQVASDRNTPSFTVGGVALTMRSFALDMGNAVEPRFLIGEEEILITGYKEMVETQVVAVPVTTLDPDKPALDPYQLALDAGEVAINLVHGTVAGRISTVNVPHAQMQRVQGLEKPQNIVEWPLRMDALSVGTDPRWSLTLT